MGIGTLSLNKSSDIVLFCWWYILFYWRYCFILLLIFSFIGDIVGRVFCFSQGWWSQGSNPRIPGDAEICSLFCLEAKLQTNLSHEIFPTASLVLIFFHFEGLFVGHDIYQNTMLRHKQQVTILPLCQNPCNARAIMIWYHTLDWFFF